VRIATHSEADLKNLFLDYQNTLSKYGINCAKFIFNMEESGIRIGCPTGAEVIAVSQTRYTNEKVALAELNHFIRYAGAGPHKH